MFFLVLIILLIPSFASAALSPAEFAQALGTSVPNQLPRSYNILQTTNLVDYRSLHILSNGVDLLRPVADTVSTRPQLLPAATRVAGSRVLLRKGLGLLGPVGVAVTVGMVGKDLYDFVKSNPSSVPSLSSAMNEEVQNYNNNPLTVAVDSVLYVNGTYYKATSVPVYVDGGGSTWNGIVGTYASIAYSDYHKRVYFLGAGSLFNSYGNASRWWYCQVVPCSAPATETKTLTEDEFVSKIAPDGYVQDSYTADFDKVINGLSDAGKTAMQPDADQIKTLTNTVQRDKATDAAQNAVDSAQDAYDSNPTAEALQALNEAKAALEAQKAAASRDDVVAPPVSDSGDYDSGIELPEKKSILSLLQSFASGSPIVSMLNSFTMSASGSGFVHLGDAFGKSIDVDFTRYESVLAGCGGVLLILVHGFAVLVVVRGW